MPALGEEALNQDDGLTTVLAELKKLFAKDNIDSQYKALCDLEGFVRKSDVTMMEYISEFEIKCRLAVDIIGTEPYADYMKAYRLIKNANLDETDARIVRSSLDDWKYDNAVNVLKKIFGSEGQARRSSSNDNAFGDSVTIKQEPTYFNEGEGDSTYFNGYRRFGGGSRGGHRGSRYSRGGRWSDRKSCWICGSPNHFKDKCPDKRPINSNSFDARRRNYHVHFVPTLRHTERGDCDGINYAEYNDINYLLI